MSQLAAVLVTSVRRSILIIFDNLITNCGRLKSCSAQQDSSAAINILPTSSRHSISSLRHLFFQDLQDLLSGEHKQKIVPASGILRIDYCTGMGPTFIICQQFFALKPKQIFDWLFPRSHSQCERPNQASDSARNRKQSETKTVANCYYYDCEFESRWQLNPAGWLPERGCFFETHICVRVISFQTAWPRMHGCDIGWPPAGLCGSRGFTKTRARVCEIVLTWPIFCLLYVRMVTNFCLLFFSSFSGKKWFALRNFKHVWSMGWRGVLKLSLVSKMIVYKSVFLKVE